MNDKSNLVDIVIPWVDGSDPKWKEEKLICQQKQNIEIKANSDVRWFNWGNLQYWFRAVERFMPWVHKIFFLTWGHVPVFLKQSCSKLQIVRHSDYIPQEYLPTFNSNTIEMNVHRIKELSENFILFNDDVFPLQSIAETYFFKDNRVCDEAVENPIMPVDIGSISGWSCRMKANNILFINRHFCKREVQKKNYDKWFCEAYGDLVHRNEGLHYWNNFCGFRDPHMANAMKKETLQKLWETEPETLHRASMNRFRGETDLSQYLIRYWQLCEGNFIPRRTLGKSFLVTSENYKEIADSIKNQEWQMVSLNEECSWKEFEKIKSAINQAFAKLLPEKSIFEV